MGSCLTLLRGQAPCSRDWVCPFHTLSLWHRAWQVAVHLGSEWSGVRGSPCISLWGSRVWASCLFAQASPPPGERVGKASGLGVPACQQSLWAGSQLQDLREKYSERGSMLTEAQEEVKTLRQQAPASTGSVTHYTDTVPLVRPPGCLPFYLCAICVYPQSFPVPGGMGGGFCGDLLVMSPLSTVGSTS